MVPYVFVPNGSGGIILINYMMETIRKFPNGLEKDFCGFFYSQNAFYVELASDLLRHFH